MKKRLISMLLTVFMVASLFSGMSLNAYAADASEVFEYTMTEGDTVLAVCNANGLNYYTCKAAIMQLNGFTSDQNFRFIPVGKVIKLPVSNAVAVSISANGVTSTTTSQTGSTTTTTTTTANANGETIAYWLIPYTLQRGETVYSVCNALGIPYSTYASQIQKINNIKSLSWVKAGQTILFPSVKTPAVGVSCYEVRAHKVTAGETAYSICNADGVSYNGNIQLLQGLNNKDNLNYIASGSTFYVPVSTVITASTGSSGSPAGSTATATPAATATAAPVSKVLYSLKGVSSTGGILGFYVDGKTVTEAAAGDVVTVVPVADKGKALKSLSVVFSDGSAVPALSGGDTFVMPKCAVTATAEFKGGYLVTIDSNYTADVKVLVDGVAGNSASTGSLVQIVSGDPSLGVSDAGIIVTRTDGKAVTVGTDNSFKMPSCDVTVKVSLESVKTYNFYKSCIAAEGSFVLQSNGSTISKAAKGAQVTVLASPSIGFSVNTITVTLRGTTTTVTVKNGVFTMPAQDVDVNVTFAAETGPIELAPAFNGTVNASDDATALSSVSVGLTGETYYVFMAPNTDYTSEKPQVKSLYDGTMVNVEDKGTATGGYDVYSFVMPGGGARITGSFVGRPYTITAKIFMDGAEVTDSGCTVYANSLSVPAGGLDVGENATVNVSVSLPEGFILKHYEVKSGGAANQELTNGANTNAAFLMPNEDVVIIAHVEAQSVAVKPLNLTSCTVRFVDNGDVAKDVTSYKVGATARIIVTPKTGYTVDPSQILVTGAVSGSAIAITQDTANPDQYTFPIPAEGVNVSVSTGKVTYAVKLSSDASLTGKLTARLDLAGAPTVLDTTGTTFKASVGEPIYIDLTDELKAQGYTISKIITTTASTGRIDYAWFNTWSFPMLAEEVTVDAVIKIPAATISTDFANCSMTTYLASDPINKVTKFYVGDEVLVKLTANAGYYLEDVFGTSLISITGVAATPGISSDGTSAEITFTMPSGQVLITSKAQQHVRKMTLEAPGEDDWVNVSADGKNETLGAAGRDIHAKQNVSVTITAEKGKTNQLDSIIVTGTVSGAQTYTANKGACTFVMPDEDVKIKINASAK